MLDKVMATAESLNTRKAATTSTMLSELWLLR